MSFWSIFPIVILFALFFMKVPVAYAMIASAASYFLWSPQKVEIMIMIQKMISSNSSFTYLAIPFFTLSGVIFNYAGISARLMDLADCLVGHFTGGMAQVNILLSTMMGGLSGSANADAALEAKMLVPQMEKRGFSKSFSCVVTAASSCITPIVPPGIILILYASASNCSVSKMFYAGYLPGFVICILMMLLTWVISKKRGYAPSREKFVGWRHFLKALLSSVWALVIPLGIIMGLRLGWFTPTEAGAVCVVYSVIIGAFVYKDLKPCHFKPIMYEAITATAGVMFILAGAQAFGQYLTWERLPNMITEMILSGVSSKYVFLIIVNVLLLVVGCFFDGGAAMILLAPLLVPAATAFGVDLVHFGIVLCINLTIAGVTPPFGSQMFVATSVTGVTIEEYARESIPYLACLIVALLLMTYVPGIVMLLPNLLA